MTVNTWSQPIRGMVDRKVVELEDTYRHVVYNVCEAIMKRTPVKSGRFLANWNITSGKPDYRYSDRQDVGRALEQLNRIYTMPVKDGFYIANGQPYGHALEYEGLSKKAPQGMIRVTLAEISMHINRAKRGG